MARRSRRLGPVWPAVLIFSVAGAGCLRSRRTPPPFTGEPYLVVWAADADARNSDFLAVIGADPTSESYGRVLRTVPVRSRGNLPYAIDTTARADGFLFAGSLAHGRTFVFDVADPLESRLVHIDEPGRGRLLGTVGWYRQLPDGRVVAAAMDRRGYRGAPRELLTAHGGLIEFTRDGEFVAEHSAAAADAPGLILAPLGVDASPALGRLVTTSEGHGYAPGGQPWMPGICVQVWDLKSLGLLHTVLLEAGPRGEENLGPLIPRFLHRRPLLLVDTDRGGALYASGSVGSDEPIFHLVYDFGPGMWPAVAAVSPDDRYYVVALTGANRVGVLDLADPYRPRPVSSVRLDRDPDHGGKPRAGRPYWLAMSADGTRLAVADDPPDVPPLGARADARVYVLLFDPATGSLSIDRRFRDEYSGEVGVDFHRHSWPHGDTGPARPRALLFVAPRRPPLEPPRSSDRWW